MLTDIKAYILSSDLCRQNIKDFQESDQFTPEEQTRIKNAYNKGWWLENLGQIPLVLPTLWLLESKSPMFAGYQKLGFYVAVGVCFGASYMCIRSWVWTYTYKDVFDIMDRIFQHQKRIFSIENSNSS